MPKNDTPAPEAKGFLSGTTPALLAAGAAFLLYAHTLSFGLTWFDDEFLFMQNLGTLLGPGGLKTVFTSDVFMDGQAPYYRPMLNVSLMLDAMARAPHYFAFHFTNVLLHSASAALLVVLLRALGAAPAYALAAALLFACHPSLAQAVAWLPGRNDPLLFAFVAPAFLFFLRWLKGGSHAALTGYCLFFSLAMFTKETAIVLPALLVLYAALVAGRRLPALAWVLFASASILPAAAWLAARVAWLPPNTGPGPINNALANLPVLPALAGKLLFPLNPQLWATSTAGPWFALASVAVAALAYRKLGGGRLALFGLAWCLAFLLPPLAADRTDYGVLFLEHRLYLPLAGVAIFFSGLDYSLLRLPRGAMAAVLAAAVLCLGIITAGHSLNFFSRETFWESATRESPNNHTAWLNLAYAYQFYGRANNAAECYNRALALNPDAPHVRHNLGVLRASQGDEAGARRYFREEASVNPSYTPPPPPRPGAGPKN